MTRVRWVTGAIAAVLVLAVVVGMQAQRQARGPQTPAEVAAMFFQAMNAGDAELAESLMSGLDLLPKPAAEEIRGELRERAVMARDGKPRTAQIVAHLQLDRVAVVVVNDTAPDAIRIDLDPAYLVRRSEGWRLLPEITEYDSPAFGFDEKAMASLHALDSWFDEQKPKLIELLRAQQK